MVVKLIALQKTSLTLKNPLRGAKRLKEKRGEGEKIKEQPGLCSSCRKRLTIDYSLLPITKNPFCVCAKGIFIKYIVLLFHNYSFINFGAVGCFYTQYISAGPCIYLQRIIACYCLYIGAVYFCAVDSKQFYLKCLSLCTGNC